MATRLGIPPTTSATDWQQQLQQLSVAAAAVNEQEQLLDMRCTHFGDLEEAQRTLQEMQQHAADAHAEAVASADAADAVDES